MTTTQTDIDKIIAQFEKTQCTPILERPNFKNLIQLKNELKANAGSIKTTLGGGAHGHLGLVLTPREYTIICPQTPFNKPGQPIPPVITQQMNNYDQVRLRSEYMDDLRLYDLTNNVEKALVNMMCQAVGEVYMKQYRNTVTNNITRPLQEVLEELFDTYGQVTSDELEQEEMELSKYEHDVSVPLVVLWDKVSYLKEVGELAKIPYSLQQLISKALRIIRNTGDLEDAIKEWHKRQGEITWEIFTKHFDNGLKELEKIRGQVKRGYMHQQANALRAMQDTINGVRADVLGVLEDQLEAQHEQQQVINNITGTVGNSDIGTILKDIQTRLTNMEQGQCRVIPKTAGNKTNWDGPAFWTKPGFEYEYCWTHGVCRHKGKGCPNKRKGHKDDATFDNRMGGSIKRFNLYAST